ncbi:hypothetical protein FISHEDRAFT_67180 [Fistulina hepatica ATCC 64428]|uniref:Metallo-hydrolase/oxidoreductase n=1 Tax=Fistulina hepatica ATCC 64428 TaxID=1128425 RepID=A0A0D7A5A7_9AGAR|nr:hypothetical protein FISHEDRAFT_67180 [Fistulina hepatica ATCC 64428]
MSDLVIRQVCPDVYTFSRPFTRMGFVPMGGRSTAVKLQNGGVWVLASTPLSPETKATIDGMGPVKFIVSADSVHHLFLSDYKNAYPDAKLIAPQAALDRHEDKQLKADGVWGRDHPDTKYGFEDEVCYFSAFRNRDVAFCHKASRTLIEADLLFNLPPNEQYSKVPKPRTFLTGNMSPNTWLHAKFGWLMGEDKEVMRNDVKKVTSWNFDRIIPCHGDVIETGGKEAWKAAYKAYLE